MYDIYIKYSLNHRPIVLYLSEQIAPLYQPIYRALYGRPYHIAMVYILTNNKGPCSRLLLISYEIGSLFFMSWS